eukprot:TRINITY_DN18142_c0_g1_i1.p1 TRINITY_DN18142_c0_g1~~TRINITY_DN18142_c0_g1_i1.p1  ORF type:complete len:368 (+),score=40.18 TRINITY_DN18142_c0_g1_i1:230-1333(+)
MGLSRRFAHKRVSRIVFLPFLACGMFALLPQARRHGLGSSMCLSGHRAYASTTFLRGATTPTPPRSPLIAGLARRVQACNDGTEHALSGLPLLVGGSKMGVILPQATAEISCFPDVFEVNEGRVALIGGGTSFEARSEAVAGVLRALRERVPMLKGWRNEAWPVKPSFDSPDALVIERAAGPLLGVEGYACHVNGLVAAGGTTDVTHLWVARRAATKQTYPGKLDHLVAGGLGYGEQPGNAVVRECLEEASIPRSLAETATPAGFVQCCALDETKWGVKRDVIFCYDLQLPQEFTPVTGDGEVESFELWSIPEVIDSLVGDNTAWKPNVALVIVDMLVRRGFVKPEEQGYVELVQSLRQSSGTFSRK